MRSFTVLNQCPHIYSSTSLLLNIRYSHFPVLDGRWLALSSTHTRVQMTGGQMVNGQQMVRCSDVNM